MEALSKSKKTTISNGSSEGSGLVAQDSKHHDAINEDRVEVSLRSKKKMISKGSFGGNGVAGKDSKEHGVVDEDSLEVPKNFK